MTASIGIIKETKRAIILKHARPDDRKGLTQVVVTLSFLALMWWAAVVSTEVSWWLTIAAILLISLFTLRVFTLMHECGHGSLFRTPSRVRKNDEFCTL